MWTERLCDAAWLSCPSVSRGLGWNESPAAHDYGVDNPETFAIQGSGGCHAPVVWSAEWLAKPIYARQDRVMKVHNGTTKALNLDHNLWPSATQQPLRR